jgi:hypothetical protein
MVGNWWGNERGGRYRFGAATRVCRAESNALAHIFRLRAKISKYLHSAVCCCLFLTGSATISSILSAAFIFDFERAHAKANSRLHEERRWMNEPPWIESVIAECIIGCVRTLGKFSWQKIMSYSADSHKNAIFHSLFVQKNCQCG